MQSPCKQRQVMIMSFAKDSDKNPSGTTPFATPEETRVPPFFLRDPGSKALGLALAIMALAGLAAPAMANAEEPVIGAYTLMAPGGGSIARILTHANTCPFIQLDGHPAPMEERSAPASPAANAQPPSFPLRICEAAIARGISRATVNGRAMALPPRIIRRIVIIGDTGCRMKAAAHAFQACNDASAWPFARLARAAAAAHPDLVLHVGDYHYRESPCPEAHSGCAGSPSGYGWDAWNADFFTPAAPLLAAAPWALVRGNHEDCARAGVGWWLLLDPHPLVAGSDCANPELAFAGNHTPPYAVELGGRARIIIADFAAIGEKTIANPEKLSRYQADAHTIAALARAGDSNFLADHYPFGTITLGEGHELQIGYPSIAQAFGAADAVPAMPQFTAIISGHTHLLQYALQRQHPPQITVGISGTLEDEPPAPADAHQINPLPSGLGISDLATRYGHFGFAVLNRRPKGMWSFTAYDLDGVVLLNRIVPRRGRPNRS